MTTMSKHFFRTAPLLGILVTTGCAATAGVDELDDEPVGEAESALAAEMTLSPNQRIVNAACLYTANPDVAVSQFAEASPGGYCNGVMIGPNVFFSAAHCGGGPTTITFRTYRNGSTAVSDTEGFTCDAMAQTFNDTDGVLFFCWPNAAGENPGDTYGDVDFDVSPPVVGQQIYSISANNQQNGGLAFTPPSDDNNLQIRVSTGDPVLVDNIAITAM
ncbi:hypothetical protein WMF27_20865 [Sorangium sp. So ce281]|uniref:hypothetical protein n=1 Tax=unclassified Sorangium TaxID=2621164 RepID=UPI003F63A013